jgi:hypothetical protein
MLAKQPAHMTLHRFAHPHGCLAVTTKSTRAAVLQLNLVL